MQACCLLLFSESKENQLPARFVVPELWTQQAAYRQVQLADRRVNELKEM
jgi:hypothetical protein